MRPAWRRRCARRVLLLRSQEHADTLTREPVKRLHARQNDASVRAFVMDASSVGQNHVGQHGVVRGVLRAVQILQAVAGEQRRPGQAKHDVLREERPVDPGDRRIGADVAAYRRGSAQRFEHGGVVEPQLVEVARTGDLRREVEVRADADQAQAGIFEIRLALFLGRAQVGDQAVAAVQRDAAAADQRDRLADPVAGVGAGEDRILEDRVETLRLVVVRILVAAGIGARTAR